MADYEVDGSMLQNALDSVLVFLASILPSPIYGIVESLITYSLTLLAALLRFGLTLVNAESWDAQKILPPLITLLAAYLALVSFYRTTGWMIRTVFWFVKWGGIIGTLAAGAGYFMGNANGNGGNGVGGFNGGLLPMLGNALLGFLDENGQNTQGTSRGSRSTRNSRAGTGAADARGRAQTKKQKAQASRPKAWESWDKHTEWQYKADASGRDDAARANEGVQEAMQKVMGVVNEAIGTGWWESFKKAVEGSGLVGANDDDGSKGSQSQRRSKRDATSPGNSR
ncbi:hypothetical protein C8Q79DRAFT_771034 [Trametes meyenii]|nr:hypothetical protein C8Q79DRAFT_771034 [Trametes meyenii]